MNSTGNVGSSCPKIDYGQIETDINDVLKYLNIDECNGNIGGSK